MAHKLDDPLILSRELFDQWASQKVIDIILTSTGIITNNKKSFIIIALFIESCASSSYS